MLDVWEWNVWSLKQICWILGQLRRRRLDEQLKNITWHRTLGSETLSEMKCLWALKLLYSGPTSMNSKQEWGKTLNSKHWNYCEWIVDSKLEWHFKHWISNIEIIVDSKQEWVNSKHWNYCTPNLSWIQIPFYGHTVCARTCVALKIQGSVSEQTTSTLEDEH